MTKQEKKFHLSWSAGSGDCDITDCLVVGRSQAILTFADDAAMSDKHAQFNIMDDQLYIIDLGSERGTFVNGARIPEKTPVALNDRDSISMGDHTFMVDIDTPIESAVEPAVEASAGEVPAVAAPSSAAVPNEVVPSETYASQGAVENVSSVATVPTEAAASESARGISEDLADDDELAPYATEAAVPVEAQNPSTIAPVAAQQIMATDLPPSGRDPHPQRTGIKLNMSEEYRRRVSRPAIATPLSKKLPYIVGTASFLLFLFILFSGRKAPEPEMAAVATDEAVGTVDESPSVDVTPAGAPVRETVAVPPIKPVSETAATRSVARTPATTVAAARPNDKALANKLLALKARYKRAGNAAAKRTIEADAKKALAAHYRTLRVAAYNRHKTTKLMPAATIKKHRAQLSAELKTFRTREQASIRRVADYMSNRAQLPIHAR